MPMIDATIPEGALTPDAEDRLIKELTDILIRAEGYDPSNATAQSVTVLFLHRPQQVYVGGTRSPKPWYRITPSVPEGQYTPAAIDRLVREVTEAVARAEGGAFDAVAPRVWVFPTDIPDGRWGGRGVIRRVPEIHAFLVGDEQQRPVGAERLARTRRAQAAAVLEAALDAVRRKSAG